ncbi:PREDICTED: uncharacterized protein LOC106109089 [Papilio polytes]|uniref:uncharacterized protein LOC106109089 n=1 Tax=Papilio polytes TaxID=76194 RepID=UPI000675E88E|nr:PREDICTED: uncharacterized protein LOC106109089 [Papilio polytes]
MPRNKCSKVDKDKILLMNTIKSRLIKISMTVDNYIYKQKTVSITQAKTYLDEISSYEPQCDGNAQYLQVIEKLTRFMNSIISDKDSIIDNSINDKVHNSIEVETTDNKEHEINTTLPISEVSNKKDRNEYSIPNENQCDLTHLSKKGTEDLPYSNRNVNMEVGDMIIPEHANTNIHNSQTSTRDILINAVKTLEITSTGPLDLRKSVYNKSFIYSQGQIISNKTTLKPVVKADKPERVSKCDVLQKFNQLKINKAAYIQDEPNNKDKYNKSMNNEYVNSKTNIRILQDQPLKTQVGTNVEYIQPSDFNIILKPQNKTAESSKNDATFIAEGKPKETAHKLETKPDISIQYCTHNVITKNKNNADERKNLPEKPKNKRKTNKQSEVKEKTIKTVENNAKKVKRVNKSCETTKAKKSKSKQNVKNNINIDLSWFDNIKFIRQVDENEYFKIKHSNRF